MGTPHHGWGDVDRSSVGTLRVLPPSGYETLVIDFPEHEAWSGLLSEVEVIPDEPDGVPDEPSDEISSVESAMAEPTSNPGRLPCVFKFISWIILSQLRSSWINKYRSKYYFSNNQLN